MRCTKDHHADAYEIRSGDATLLVVFKYSTKKRSPWQFSFASPQVDALHELRALNPTLPLAFAFVCHTDGVCGVFLEELGSIGLGIDILAGSNVSVSRPRAGSYWISGPGRTRMRRSIPQNRWSRILKTAPAIS